ncbi:MAG: hypothetical protein JWL85_834 [Candidatus Saccharibacteria bacterium]|nr:hypothetical protein [Candidatus Saccharibacteria bacterium]
MSAESLVETPVPERGHCVILYEELQARLQQGRYQADRHYLYLPEGDNWEAQLDDYFFYCHRDAQRDMAETVSYRTVQERILQEGTPILSIRAREKARGSETVSQLFLLRPCDVVPRSFIGKIMQRNDLDLTGKSYVLTDLSQYYESPGDHPLIDMLLRSISDTPTELHNISNDVVYYHLPTGVHERLQHNAAITECLPSAYVKAACLLLGRVVELRVDDSTRLRAGDELYSLPKLAYPVETTMRYPFRLSAGEQRAIVVAANRKHITPADHVTRAVRLLNFAVEKGASNPVRIFHRGKDQWIPLPGFKMPGTLPGELFR